MACNSVREEPTVKQAKSEIGGLFLAENWLSREIMFSFLSTFFVFYTYTQFPLKIKCVSWCLLSTYADSEYVFVEDRQTTNWRLQDRGFLVMTHHEVLTNGLSKRSCACEMETRRHLLRRTCRRTHRYKEREWCSCSRSIIFYSILDFWIRQCSLPQLLENGTGFSHGFW